MRTNITQQCDTRIRRTLKRNWNKWWHDDTMLNTLLFADDQVLLSESVV